MPFHRVVERSADLTSMLAPFRDAWLAGRARLALLASASHAGDVNVEAYHGRVQLSGDVRTAVDRSKAERAVRALPGVVGVTNLIRVRGAESGFAPSTDAEVRAAVTAALSAARQLRGSRIHVGAVYDRVVTLVGTARSDNARATAFEIAVHVPGVRRVVSDVAVSSTADVGHRANAA
jgi:osmotically-inducible protein OsmY